MLYVGLDLSRKRLDWQALEPGGGRAAFGAVRPDRDGLAHLVWRLGDAGVVAVIESMSGPVSSTISSSGTVGMCASPMR